MGSKSFVSRLASRLSNFVHDTLQRTMLLKGVLFGFVGAGLWLGLELPLSLVAIGLFGLYLVTGGWRFTWVILRTLPRDLRGLYLLITLKYKIKRLTKANANLPSLFAQTVARHPNKAAFLYEDRVWTFRDVDEYSNAVANYFRDHAGYRQGDVVAIFMESRPEFVCIWLGLAKIGVIAALINFNLRLESLAHCIKISEAKAVIFGGELVEAIRDVKQTLSREVPLYCSGKYSNGLLPSSHLDKLVDSSSKLAPPTPFIKFKDRLFYIYTSGTTGLPKAAVVIHNRFYYMTMGIFRSFYMRHDDIIYDTLPLYHTAGGILGVGNCLINGCTLAVRRKFSASNFWSDCVKYNCTVVQYIGEICRYLLAQPERPVERQHRVRMAFGNGLRPQIWGEFMKRFNIKRIGEFYGATEGNANILNIDNTLGAVGFTTRLAPFMFPITLIRVDEATGEPIRDRNGVCIRAKPGESGELVGKIIKGDPFREFDGYVNKSATDKKIAYDVFHKGDSAFLTGDILTMNEYGYFFFKDRTGDTFRWRGENVSTFEVETVISNIIKQRDSVAYGVEIPGVEGRAGMAAIVDESRSIDLVALRRDLHKSLPAYARPVFIRLMDEVDTTGTFKLKKTDLRKEGFNPSNCKATDHLYYMDTKTGEYQPLTKQIYMDICRGKMRF